MLMRNGGAWTEARWRAFVKGGLRGISNRWPPKGIVKKKAWRGRGLYECAGYGCKLHTVPVSVVNDKGKRVNNVFVDHIDPVIDVTGFTTWDDEIGRASCRERVCQYV